MNKPNAKKLIKEILSGDVTKVVVSVTNKALEWMIAGLVEEANQLLRQLWKLDVPHSKDLGLADEALQMMWQISNRQPDRVPFLFKEISAIEAENWSRNFYPKWHESYTNSFIDKDLSDLKGQERFVKAIVAAYEKSESMACILKALETYIEQDKPIGYNHFHATTCACLIAVRQPDQETIERLILLWGKGYLAYSSNYELTYLMRDSKCAEYLLKGTLAPVFGFATPMIHKELKELTEALSNRINQGQSLVDHELTWELLLDKIAKIALQQKTIDFATPVLTKAPATSEAIRLAENRLNVTLPKDYKEFLLTSNGFECFSSTGVSLAPVEQIDYLVKVDSELVTIWTNSMEEVDSVFCMKLRDSIIIGGHEEEQQLLLIPLADCHWECWHFSSWTPGEVSYPSFRFYMESELHVLEEEDLPDEKPQ